MIICSNDIRMKGTEENQTLLCRLTHRWHNCHFVDDNDRDEQS